MAIMERQRKMVMLLLLRRSLLQSVQGLMVLEITTMHRWMVLLGGRLQRGRWWVPRPGTCPPAAI